MHKIVLLRKNGQIEVFISPKMPSIAHKKNHAEIRWTNKARKKFALIVSRHDSAKVEFTN